MNTKEFPAKADAFLGSIAKATSGPSPVPATSGERPVRMLICKSDLINHMAYTAAESLIIVFGTIMLTKQLHFCRIVDDIFL
jgi:hypothetical protein